MKEGLDNILRFKHFRLYEIWVLIIQNYVVRITFHRCFHVISDELLVNFFFPDFLLLPLIIKRMDKIFFYWQLLKDKSLIGNRELQLLLESQKAFSFCTLESFPAYTQIM